MSNLRYLLPAALVVALAPLPAVASSLSDGFAAYHAKNYSAAAADFQAAASTGAASARAKAEYMEGLAYHHMGQNAQAVSAYQQAQRDDPSLSFQSAPGSFARNFGIAQRDSGAPAPTGAAAQATAQSDPAALTLTGGDVYVSPGIPNVNTLKLDQAAHADPQTVVKIALLAHLPSSFVRGNADRLGASAPAGALVSAYAHWLHSYLNLGENGLIVVALHPDTAGGRVPAAATTGVADVAKSLSDSQESAIARDYVASIGAGNYNTALPAMAATLAAQATASFNRPMDITLWIVFIVLVLLVLLIWSASRRKRVQITSMRGPIEQQRDQVVRGIERIDGYVNVLPKNNADSDQVRAFRQAAAYKVDQAEKIMARSTEVSDMNRAQALLDQAAGDVENGRRYLDRATGGKGTLDDDDAVRPVPFPANQGQVSQVPHEQRGVSFFSSQPAPVSQLVPVTLDVDGQQRTVMATPQEAEMIRRGQTPPVRSFNVGGQQVPWYGYQNYDPYRDYWTYQNNGWRGIAGGAIAGFFGAELLGSLFSPRPMWGGNWLSPYAYGPGWDSWGGWGGYGFGGGGYDQGYIQGEESARAQDMAFQDQYSNPQQDTSLGSGAGFSDAGYDTSDYGSGAGFGTGDQS